MTAAITLAALLPTLLALLIFWSQTRKEDKKIKTLLLWLLILEIPMSALVYYGIRHPASFTLGEHIQLSKPGLEQLWPYLGHLLYPYLDFSQMIHRLPYGIMKILEAPFTEEPAKLWPLLIPFFRRNLSSKNAVKFALALGFGFGIGEIWTLAFMILAKNPEATRLPFYQFYQLGGFISERLLVCIMHSTFTFFAVSRIGNRFWLGFLQAMGLHYLGNFPIFFVPYVIEQANIQMQGVFQYLTERHILSPSMTLREKKKWMEQLILGSWVTVYFLFTFILLIWKTQKVSGESILGEVICPGCNERYSRPLFAFNFGPRRYERCSHCKKWHWTKVVS